MLYCSFQRSSLFDKMYQTIMMVISFLTLIRPSIQQFDINIADNCAPNTNVYDLNFFINPPPSQYKMVYTLSKSYRISEYFEIKNDKIFTKSTIDLDLLCSGISECCDKTIDYCNLKMVILYDSTLNSMATKNLQIHITDINDHSPHFDRQSFEIEVSEGKKDPFMLVLPIAIDEDFGRNRIESYQIGRKEPSSFDDFFTLVTNKNQPVPTQVSLRLNKMLDREIIGRFSFELLAMDGDLQMRKTGSTLIIIKIIDENDNCPIFHKTLYREIIKEGVFNNLPIIILSATDIDEGENAKILYNLSPNFISDTSITDQFRIGSNGKIFLRKALDYERQVSYRFTVSATNPTMFINNRLTSSTATVEIEVENVNDEPLQIIIDYFGGKNWSEIKENSNDVVLAFITTRSKESERKNFGVACKLQSFVNVFELLPKHSDDASTKLFEVRNIIGIDREKYSRIQTNIICSESNIDNGKSSEVPLVVLVLDENDNSPEMTIKGRTNVLENERKGKVILIVNATDPDEGENGRISFSLDKSDPISLEYLTIGERDGKIKVSNPIDCEVSYRPLTNLMIIVTATDHGKPPKSADMKLNIHVEDVNDNRPTFVNFPSQFSISENKPSYTLIGEFEVQDKDHNDKVTLRIVKNNHVLLPFIITTKDNKIFMLNSTRSIDREKDSMFKFDIVAIDGTGKFAHTVTESIEVKILDVNDNSPTIIFPTQNNASVHRMSYLEPINHKLILVSANDQDQLPDNSRLEYSIEDDTKIFGITNEEKFIITQREMTKSDIGEHRITIVVRDCGLPPLKSSVTINIVIDQSSPKSVTSSNNKGYIYPNGDRSPDNIFTANSDIVLYVIVIVILFVIVIIIVVFVYFLRRCNPENNCSHNGLLTCCQSPRPSPAMSKSMISSPTSRSNFNEDKQIYNNHQSMLLNNEKLLDEKNSSEQWNSEISQVPHYNITSNQYMSTKAAYTKLPNHSQCYYPFQYPNIYQTIGENNLAQKQNDLTMKRMQFYQTGVKNNEQYKSELNLKRWNFSAGDPSEVFAGDNMPGAMWITSQTPLPTRSRTVTNTIVDSDSVDDNFAVAFPQDQSTFV